jgi:diguanylate cyclase (GGDEF)-like protein
MKRPLASVSSSGGSLERAHLVRAVAELFSTDAPLVDLWPRCCALIAELMESRRVQIVLCEPMGERIVYAYTAGAGLTPADGTVSADSLGAEVVARGETAIRRDGAEMDLGVPIRFGRTLFGAICLEGVAAHDAERVTLLESCALHAGARLYHESSVASSERYAKLAFTDGLTGVANRRNFDDVFAREWSRAARDRSPLSLLMIDLDFFKSFNDSYGHQAGDLSLQRVARALQECVTRPADLLARYGGEEFVALLPGTDVPGAIAIGLEMQAKVESLRIAHGGSSLGRLSLSIGAASAQPAEGIAAESLLHAADDALYRAKLGGRNRLHARDYDIATEAARPRRVSAHTNLPLQLTRIVGRRTEIAQIQGLLAAHRLVSIVGAGGTGKTRAAVEVASEISGRFSDGAWFVDLAPISDPALVAARIANAVSAENTMGADSFEALAVTLEAKDALLVIDNCEHLIGDVASLAIALLRHCHKLVILTTSREPLGVVGEAVYRLPLLSMPPPDATPSPAEAAAFDAISLFVQRAKEAELDFELNDDNVAKVIEICRAVDGIALAIELAASRVGVIGLANVAQRLREFRLLSGGDRAAVARQRTMHATIGWSYDLLAEPERALLRRLSVFAGAFTLEAATDTCTGPAVEAEDVFDLLSSLIRKSLVAGDCAADDRYRLLDSIRAFAGEKLREEGESSHIARRHAEFFAALARRKEALAPDADNLRAALEWALDKRGDITLGAELTATTFSFFADALPAEAVRWALTALELLPAGAASRIEARLCTELAAIPRSLPAAQLRVFGERGIALSRALGDRRMLADGLRNTAQTIGWFYREERELADALACESIAIARELDDPVALALGLRTRGLTIDIADIPAKREVLEESLALLRLHGNDRQVAQTLTWISDFEFSAGDHRRAFEYGLEAVRFAERAGSYGVQVTATVNLVNYACALGEWEAARQASVQAITLCRKTRNHMGLTFAVQACALMAAQSGRSESAARMIGFCNARCGVLHAGRQADQSEQILYERLMTDLRQELGEKALSEAMRAGAGMTEEEATSLALALTVR